MRIVEKFNAKLLVEGNDDQHVIWALCHKLNLAENFDVIDCDGNEKLVQQIPLRFKQSGVETIGIIIDADADVNGRWHSLKDLLLTQGFKIPDALPDTGLIATNGSNQKVGVWIMPDNNINGMLEDFISFLIPEDDQLLPIVISNLQLIEEEGLNKYALIHQSKARIHNWLALQENPGTPLGLSITKRYLTTEKAICLKLTNWLQSLFRPD